ncbi:hypothetical protein V1264_005342 [Littorina saxatilis]|uniref:Alpha-1,3-mannosyl-glycoprotein 2-beta-N-acetylglucosaminyltransferase n=1 Tax=Littorina saxatilis TaxID=31220 RepID=A0AAN9B1C5_9CAEN
MRTLFKTSISLRQELEEERGMEDRINGLQSQIAVQMKDNQLLLDKLRQLQPLADDIGRKEAEKGAAARAAAAGKVPALPPLEDIVLPILMIACDRTTVSRSLDILLKYRPSAKQFPIIVSQDCGHEATSTVIQSYITAKHTSYFKHIKHPDLSDIKLPWPQKKFMGYYKIARHYKWALNQVFHVLNHSAVIIVEDDLDIAPDFFEYFLATYPLLHKDPLLWCVSAWNDNGKGTLVSNEAEKLYRTDFFPGLGWMIERSMWTELGPKWPDTFWDDWMRHPEQRKDRQCIRPEICRTSTFGKKGVSKGLFFEKHLKYIKLNDKFVPFTQKDLSYLEKDRYDTDFVKEVYSAVVLSSSEALSGVQPEEKKVRVQYATKDEFKKLAKALGIMEDLKAGVPRAAYRGVVSFMLKGRRVYLAPPPDWKGYDITWT